MCTNPATETRIERQLPVQPNLANLFKGSRRLKLWELPELFHCPVIGVCVSNQASRRLIAKVTQERVPDSDYECHSLAVSSCRQRGPFSELVQKELDAKYGLAIQQCRTLDQPAALLAAWKAAVARGDIAGSFWALITHPKSTADVMELIYRDVHMIQHQVGASIRVDLQEFNALGRENAMLLREMGKIQKRMTDFAREKTALIDKLSTETLRRDQELIHVKEQLLQLENENQRLSQAGDLIKENQRQQELIERLTQKNHAHVTEIIELRAAIVSMQKTVTPRAPLAIPGVSGELHNTGQRLQEKTVFVVGGRLGSTSEYRSTVEQSGARFMFHDGGVEQSLHTLESGLQAADYVICQTGCISHASYWKVKDFCKRTGKRCVYVESPGISSLRQTIDQLCETA